MEEYIKKILNELDPDHNRSKMKLHTLVDANEENSTHKIATIYGGLNGWGDWIVYLLDISEFMHKLENEYDCWLLSLKNDPADDLFELKICIDEKRDS